MGQRPAADVCGPAASLLDRLRFPDAAAVVLYLVGDRAELPTHRHIWPECLFDVSIGTEGVEGLVRISRCDSSCAGLDHL